MAAIRPATRLRAQPATVEGVGPRLITGSGELAAAVASITADAHLGPQGVGVLLSARAQVEGLGVAGHEGAGVLQAQAAQVEGSSGPGPLADWTARSTAPGVTMATNFDVADDVFDFAVDDASHFEHETTIKRSGGGALKILIADSDGTSGWDYWRFLNDTMEPFGSPESGLAGEYYLSYSVYIPLDYYNWIFSMDSSGHKKFSICSQKPSNTVNPVTRASLDFVGNARNGSSVKNEIVVNDYGQRMHPMVYMNNPNGSARAFEFDNQPVTFDFQYQNAIDEGVKSGTPLAYPGDARSQSLRNLVAQTGFHKNYAGNPTQGQSRLANSVPHPDPIAAGPRWRPGWNHYMHRVKFPTTWAGTDGIFEAWMCHDGDADWTKFISVTGTHPDAPVIFHDPEEISNGVPYNGGVDGWYHVGLWLTPFRTDGVAETGVRPSTFLVYDEVIVSINPIAAPTRIPTYLATANEWVDLSTLPNGNTYQSIVPAGASGNDPVGARMRNWNGGANDQQNLYIGPEGGHGGSSDNGVDKLGPFNDDDGPSWSRIGARSPTQDTCVTHYADGKPTSRHGRGLCCVVDGIAGFSKRLFHVYSHDPWCPSGALGNATDAFRLDTNAWDVAETYTDAPSPGNRADCVAYDSVAQKIVMFHGGGTGNAGVRSYDPVTDTYTSKVTGAPLTFDIYGRAICAPFQRIAMLIGDSGDSVFLVNLDDYSDVIELSNTLVSWAGNGGLAYDPKLGPYGSFLVWGGGSRIDKIPIPSLAFSGGSLSTSATWAGQTISTSGVTPSARQTNGTWGRFAYIPDPGCIVVVNDIDETGFAIRLA